MEKSKKKAKRAKNSNFSKIVLGIIVLIAIIVGIDAAMNGNKISNNNTEQASALYEENTEANLIGDELVEVDETVILDEETEDEIIEEEPPVASEKENTNKTTSTTKTSSSQKDIPYYIKVNYGQNVVTIYKKDDNGNYSIPIKAMVCSSGVATPKSGVYPISQKMTWGSLKGGVAGQYCTRIIKSILFHSVPYTKIYDKSSLEYWEYDKLGTKASAGCIRLTVQDAQWIFNNCVAGTKVEFYSDSNPGPLGKPSARKISDEVEVRGWDPTDPAPENPWKNYKKDDTKVDNNTTAQPEKPKENVENKVENKIQNIVTNEVKNENTINNKVDNKIENTINNKVENTVENKVTNKVNNTVNSVEDKENTTNTIENIVENKVENTIKENKNEVSNVVEKVKNEVINNTVE
ncbi:MAG: L,D-transpeptidase family protein [Clostridia bacterium]|nr:L,D-transpeptidase family protein [Clostridia bacterium]